LFLHRQFPSRDSIVQRTCAPSQRKRFARNFGASGGKNFCVNFPKGRKHNGYGGHGDAPDPDKPRDHLDVFREFIDHLGRNARTAAHDKRRRANAR
jgi:hypothetical protein